MRKALLTSVAAVALLVVQVPWLAAASRWVPLDGASAPEGVSFRVLSSGVNEVVCEVSFEGLYAEDVQTEGGMFMSLGIPGESFTTDIGQPRLPVVRRMFEVPHGALLSVSIAESEVVEIPLERLGDAKRVVPLQEPLPKVEGAAERARFVIDERQYGYDTYSPASPARVFEAGFLREHRIGVLEFGVVSYNPVLEKIRFVKKALVRVRMEGGSAGLTRQAVERCYSRPFERMLENVLLNHPLTGAPSPPALPVGYLVIAEDAFVDGVTELVAWKEKKGFHVTVTPLSDISPPTQTGIQAYIRDAYDTWPVPPTYVLLVGDHGFIPAFQGSESSSVTDLYYAQMNPGDYLMDLSVGRLTCRSTAELTDIVAKIMEYEHDLPVVGDWMERAVFMASLDNYQTSEGTHNFVIDNYLNPAGMICTKVYARLGGDTQDIFDNLNAGRTIANYSGHGSTGGWANPAFDQADIGQLTNDGMYPFVISNACLTGDFELTECFGETWLKAAGKGAIAHWGASNVTYWDEDDILEKKLWRVAFEDTVFDIGRMTDQALIELYEHYGGGGNCQYYFEVYNVFGDPSINLWTDVALPLSLTYPVAVIIGTVPVPVSVQMDGLPVAGALVSLVKDDEVFESGYTDGAGLVTLTVSTSTPGDLDLTVTAHNALPAEMTISVVPPEGPYVVLGDFTLDDSLGGNDDGTVDFGETIDVHAGARNVGVETAHEVTAILRTDDEFVSVTDSMMSFGEIPPDSIMWGAGTFAFEVSSDTPDGHTVSFTFTATDANDSVWTSPFAVTVQAPVLVYESYLVDDSSGGDGDGEADPGETVDVYLTLLDEGTGEATGIGAGLSTSDPFITILEEYAEFPDVEGGGVTTSLTAYRLEISPDCPQGYLAPFGLEITADGPYATTGGFTLLIGQKPILIVDDDVGGSHETNYTTTLDDLGYPYDVWDYDIEGTPPLAVLQAYRTVIWTTADDYGSPGTLTSEDEVVLMDYLDGEGTLFLSSQDFLYDNGLDTFATQYLHVSWYDSDEYVSQITGVAGDPIGDGLTINLTYPFSNWSDDMLPDGEAAVVFENTGYSSRLEQRSGGVPCASRLTEGQGRAYAGAIRYPAEGTAAFRTVFFAVPFDAIPAGPSRSTVMENVLLWLWETLPNVTISLEPDSLEVPQGGRLGYTLTARNNTPVSQEVSYWTNITLPGGGTYPPSGFLMGPLTGTLAAGQEINVHISHDVPTKAPTLTYTYNAIAGPYPDVWHEGHFDFSVVPARQGDRYVEDWTLAENGLLSHGFTPGDDIGPGLASASTLPKSYAMLQNFPNPFNPQTTVRYDVPGSAGEGVRVLLRVYSVRGRLVRTLVDEVKEPGRYVVHWDGRGESGRELGSGIYLYLMQAGDYTSARKMLMMR